MKMVMEFEMEECWGGEGEDEDGGERDGGREGCLSVEMDEA